MGAGVWVGSKEFTNESFTATSWMTVLKLADGRLVIHSPIALDPELQREVANLGEVVAMIAPNRSIINLSTVGDGPFPPLWFLAVPVCRLTSPT